jgi:hypothetical protein
MISSVSGLTLTLRPAGRFEKTAISGQTLTRRIKLTCGQRSLELIACIELDHFSRGVWVMGANRPGVRRTARLKRAKKEAERLTKKAEAAQGTSGAKVPRTK